MRSKSSLPYSKKSARSIERHAKQMEGRSLKEVYGPSASKSRVAGKGGLGSMIEKLHFRYEPNSDSRPDFPEAGVELKVSPLRSKKGKVLSVKERLVLNVINFENAATERSFKAGAFWRKNELLLLMFYLWRKRIPKEVLQFKLARLWTYPPEDLKIIRDDWLKIIEMIRQGRAHHLSERDTLYLAACTKGKDSKQTRRQRHGPRAKQRAYSLKRSYVDQVFAQLSGLPTKQLTRPIAAPLRRSPGETFEGAVVRRMARFSGLGEGQLKARLRLRYKASAKNRLHLLARAMLGSPSEEIEEFLKADVQMKTIRLNVDGSLNEHMSFRQIEYDTVVNEKWDDSTFHDELNKRLFFVVFQKDRSGESKFIRSFFFGMPEQDFRQAASVWKQTREVLKARRAPYRFPAAVDNCVAHVRPKARNSKDRYLTSWGHRIHKMAFWLNKDYILRIVQQQLAD